MNQAVALTAAEGTEPAGPSLLPDPWHLWAVFRRRLWIFVAVAVLTLAAVGAYVFLATPIYSATANIVIEPRQQRVINFDPSVPQQVSSDTNVVDTEVQTLSSPALADRVVKALHLERYPEYAPKSDGAPRPANPLRQVSNKLLHNVFVKRDGTSYSATVTAQAGDPQLASMIANEFVRQYILRQDEIRAAATRAASASLQGRLNELREEVVAADAALQRYTVAHGLMSAEGATMAEQEVSQLNQQISQARADAAEKAGRLAAARAQLGRGGGGADVGAALGSNTISDLRRQETEVSRQLAQLTARHGDQFPDVRKTREELANIEGQIQREINRIMSSLSAESQAAQSRLGSLISSQRQASGALASNGSAQVGLLELQRKAEAARAVYTAFLNRARETASEEGLTPANARIDSLSTPPVLPSSPNYKLAAAFGFAAAMLFGLIGVALAEYLDSGVRTKADIERRLRVRYAGAVPDLRSTVGRRNKMPPEDYLVGYPYSAFTEAFRALRTSLMLGHRTACRVIAITSALPREGKSTTSICLARSLATAGIRTALVDCDLRRRQTSAMLLPEGARGLLDYLDGKTDIDGAMAVDKITECAVLGTNVLPPEPRDLFGPGQLDQLLGELRRRFDVVLIDTAPVLGIAETRTIAAAADSTLMLARWRKTSIKAVDTAIELLLAAQVRLHGVVLTIVDVRKHASTGYDDYSYQAKFTQYYQN
jgi:capsular exopolysaccharide synthesis family protein